MTLVLVSVTKITSTIRRRASSSLGHIIMPSYSDLIMKLCIGPIWNHPWLDSSPSSLRTSRLGNQASRSHTWTQVAPWRPCLWTTSDIVSTLIFRYSSYIAIDRCMEGYHRESPLSLVDRYSVTNYIARCRCTHCTCSRTHSHSQTNPRFSLKNVYTLYLSNPWWWLVIILTCSSQTQLLYYINMITRFNGRGGTFSML